MQYYKLAAKGAAILRCGSTFHLQTSSASYCSLCRRRQQWFDLLRVSLTGNCGEFHINSATCRRKKETDRESRAKSKIVPSSVSSSGLSLLKSTATKDSVPLFKPVVVRPNPDDLNFGEELAGKLNKEALLKMLNKFYSSNEVRELAREHGLDDYLYNQVYSSFRRFCLDKKHLTTELHILFSDILQGVTHNHDIFPYFLTHAKKVFPHLDCMEELKTISDLTNPPNWYPEARAINRKVIFHAGPTNSGKTYHALERFLSAKSGIYCGPLKLLAVEVTNKSLERGVPCDLVTGEERKMVNSDGSPCEHISCTIEMSNLAQKFEVAVIDEIQVIKDYQRGWAWTRALLGLQAEEIHVCGEPAAIDLVREMMISTGEEVEVRNYKRLTPLKVESSSLENISNTQPGDCVVCFNKNDIYNVSRALEKQGKDVAVIYGSLPPNTKLAMAKKVQRPARSMQNFGGDRCIGMGLNLNIRRVIFYSINKIHLLENGEKEVDVISVSQALQIAGRAGRFGTQWEDGYVTTFKREELEPLKNLLSQTPDEILQAGLHPTYDQLELYSYHLPAATLSNLVDIFISLSTLDDSLYTLCHLEDFKFIANMIEHIRLPLKAKYTFCCAPLNRKMAFVNTMFLKITRQFSVGELISFDWLCTQVGWPFSHPETILDLMHLEAVHDVFDIYLWLSYRFPDMFPDVQIVREVQIELDKVIEEGVINIVQLLKNNENEYSSRTSFLDEDKLEVKSRQGNEYKKKWTHMDANIAGNSRRETSAVAQINDDVSSVDQDLQQVKLKPRLVPRKKKKNSSQLLNRLVSEGVITRDIANQLGEELKDIEPTR